MAEAKSPLSQHLELVDIVTEVILLASNPCASLGSTDYTGFCSLSHLKVEFGSSVGDWFYEGSAGGHLTGEKMPAWSDDTS